MRPLDSTAQRLPNPTLLRNPTLRTEAQSTSALEGTYAPLADVLAADDDEPGSIDLREILNYVRAGHHAFAWLAEDRPLTVGLLKDLQGMLMRGMPLQSVSGALRDIQVAIGRRVDARPDQTPVHRARFVPPPPTDALRDGIEALVAWLGTDHRGQIDPVVAAAMAHYQFETLHPFRDGNGRIGRLLIVLQLHTHGVLQEPTLTVSPWFESRRETYYDALLGVSTTGAWDPYVRFFAQGLAESASRTHRQVLDLVAVQEELRAVVRASSFRSDKAPALVDVAVANPTFTVRQVSEELGVGYGRANALVGQLVDLEVLRARDPHAYQRRFYAPRVFDVLTGAMSTSG